MRSNRTMSFVSVVVVGIAVLLSPVCAQSPPTTTPTAPMPAEEDTFEAFFDALTQHENRMEEVQAQFEATLPHSGPWTDYQLRLLNELEGPRPWRVEASIHQCLQGGSGGRVSMTTLLNRASIVVSRGRAFKSFRAKTGFRFSRPTATNHAGVIRFEGSTSDSRRSATADFEDRYAEGQWAPHGFAGSGRYKVTCSGPSGSYSQSWSWRLFRDGPAL